MKKFFIQISLVSVVYIIWRILLEFIEKISVIWWPLMSKFAGSPPWTNFDGLHYLSIAQQGYAQFQQAFFPLYPLLIKGFSILFFYPPHKVALIISNVSIFVGAFFLYRLLAEKDKSQAKWSLLYLFFFPTSFFFAASYTESLFFMLSIISYYASLKKHWLLAGIFGMFAATTRLFGTLLLIIVSLEYLKIKKKKLIDVMLLSLIPLGLVTYALYLWLSVGDPLAFFHSQAAFGAGRSADKLVFLPQVFWRYVKILLMAYPYNITYIISFFEMIFFLMGLWLLWVGWRLKISKNLLLYSLLVLIVPSLTGTLSSMPRYSLSAFPLFFVLGKIDNIWIKIGLLIIFVLGSVFFASLFLRGYFVA